MIYIMIHFFIDLFWIGADAEKLRLAGLLMRDYRHRERNKCGHDGARATWTWKKR